ncbi:hypothetical protein CIL05_17835 [Virgibacillus profundi]|uniref:YdhG-like domain-containing protein n=1 Tax=Virgibacillus profundi TaxID=2024555 RepID=A0A2A2I9B4_9BACI|nr:DUF1801 domain-containing protein [Virgibacillus profundi]PAV28227.1 hypothetical protein CIL05_17835 [Virgibacillus profundi]PXY52532.1 DUF1801 domain-containing protein [Virgibacillus profundi]
MDNHKRKIKEVDQYILNLPADIGEITGSLRELIFSSSPELIEEFKWSMPNYSCKGLVCYLQASKKHVNLGFQKGNELQEKDVENLLQGTGKTMRHIRIKKMEDIKPEVFTSLIQAAMALNEN